MATNAENRTKNGNDSIVPYDRNRVILTPDGTRPHSTYINASFIEGYHNDESFIITQVVIKLFYLMHHKVLPFVQQYKCFFFLSLSKKTKKIKVTPDDSSLFFCHLFLIFENRLVISLFVVRFFVFYGMIFLKILLYYHYTMIIL